MDALPKSRWASSASPLSAVLQPVVVENTRLPCARNWPISGHCDAFFNVLEGKHLRASPSCTRPMRSILRTVVRSAIMVHTSRRAIRRCGVPEAGSKCAQGSTEDPPRPTPRRLPLAQGASIDRHAAPRSHRASVNAIDFAAGEECLHHVTVHASRWSAEQVTVEHDQVRPHLSWSRFPSPRSSPAPLIV